MKGAQGKGRGARKTVGGEDEEEAKERLEEVVKTWKSKAIKRMEEIERLDREMGVAQEEYRARERECKEVGRKKAAWEDMKQRSKELKKEEGGGELVIERAKTRALEEEVVKLREEVDVW